MAGKALDGWARKNGVGLHFIEPGNPAPNIFIESLNGRFRGYLRQLGQFRAG